MTLHLFHMCVYTRIQVHSLCIRTQRPELHLRCLYTLHCSFLRVSLYLELVSPAKLAGRGALRTQLSLPLQC